MYSVAIFKEYEHNYRKPVPEHNIYPVKMVSSHSEATIL